MRKIFLTLLALTSLTAQARHSEVNPIQAIENDARLDNTSCLRELSTTECSGAGELDDGPKGWGSCQTSVNFRLNNGVIVTYELIGSASKHTSNPVVGIAGLAASILTLTASNYVFKYAIGAAAVEEAKSDLDRQIRKMSKVLVPKGVTKCADFQNGSNIVENSGIDASAD